MALPSILSHDDLNKFRTRLCERLLQQGECSFGSKCQYSHNLAWRRRSPAKAGYRPSVCPHLHFINDLEILECDDRTCRYAHSLEEIFYHPDIYKKIPCASLSCSLYYCPFSHEISEKFPITLSSLGLSHLDLDKMLSEISSFQLSHVRSSPFPPLSPAELAAADPHVWLAVAPGLLVEATPRVRTLESEISRGIFSFRGERRGVVVKTMYTTFSPEIVLEHEKICDQEFSLVRRVMGNFVVMDRCVTSLEQGISDSLLRRWLPVLPRKLSEIFRQLAHMHSLGIAHGRLTPGNFLVDAEGHWRLGDFFGKKFPVTDGAFAGDVMSAGGTVIFAVSGNSRKFPIFSEAAREVGLEEISMNFPTLADLLRRCTLPEAEDRPTAEEVLEHPFFWTSEMIGNFFVRVEADVMSGPGAVVVRNVLGEGILQKFPITKLYDAVRLAETYADNLQFFFERYTMIDLWEDDRLARVAAALQGREVVGLDRLLDESLLTEVDSERKNSTLPPTPLSASTADDAAPWRYAVQCPPPSLDECQVIWRSSSP